MISDTTYLGAFQGSQAPNDLMDGLLAYSVSGPDIDVARALVPTKWWDYRFVHPGHCLFYFSELYAEHCRDWASRFGTASGRRFDSYHPIWTLRTKKGDSFRSLRPKQARTSIWRAMCCADAHGIPYKRFLTSAFESCMERGWDRLPTPAELYTLPIVRKAVEDFDRESKELLHLPADPRFHAAQYDGHPFQDECQQWMLKLVQGRALPARAAFNLLFNEKVLVPKIAAQVLPHRVIAEVKRLAAL